MKINYAHLITFILMLICGVGLLLFVSSCDVAKQSVRHYDKFIKKGGVVRCDTIVDTLEVIVKGAGGRDSLIFVPVDKICPDVTFPETRYETRWAYRYDLKRQKARDKFLIDSLAKVNKGSKIEVKREKQDTKQVRAENRRSNWWKWLLLGLIVGSVGTILIFRRR